MKPNCCECGKKLTDEEKSRHPTTGQFAEDEITCDECERIAYWDIIGEE